MAMNNLSIGNDSHGRLFDTSTIEQNNRKIQYRNTTWSILQKCQHSFQSLRQV